MNRQPTHARRSRCAFLLLGLASAAAHAQSPVYTHGFDSTAGWPDSDQSGDLSAVYTVVDSEYLINPLQSGRYALAIAPVQTPGAGQVVEADIRLAASQAASRAGVACRVSPGAQRFYAFNLVHAGGWEIVRVEGDQGEILASGPLSDALDMGVRVRAECLGDALSMLVDGRTVGSVRDTRLQEATAAGLLSVSPVVAATNAAFDNFVLSAADAVGSPASATAPAPLSPMRGGGGAGDDSPLPQLDDLALFNDAGGRPGDRQSLFDVGHQRVYAVLEISSGARARFRAEWRAVRGGDETVLTSSDYDNHEGHTRVWLYADRDWGAGLYRVDLYANGRLLEQREFSVY